MSGLAETIARRSAGLAPPAGRQLLQLRARTRFDPGSLSGPGMDVTVEVPAGAPVESIRPEMKAPATERVASPRTAESVEPRPEAPPERIANVQAAPTRWQAIERAPEPLAAQLPSPRVAEHAELPRSEARGETHYSIAESLAPTRQAERLPGSMEATVASAPSAAPVPKSPRSLPARTTAHPQAKRTAPTRETKPQVTITIGRIAIDFGHESPPAPAPTRTVQRTRGFENYSDARRGRRL
jgi:hypothetical protein